MEIGTQFLLAFGLVFGFIVVCYMFFNKDLSLKDKLGELGGSIVCFAILPIVLLVVFLICSLFK